MHDLQAIHKLNGPDIDQDATTAIENHNANIAAAAIDVNQKPYVLQHGDIDCVIAGGGSPFPYLCGFAPEGWCLQQEFPVSDEAGNEVPAITSMQFSVILRPYEGTGAAFAITYLYPTHVNIGLFWRLQS